MSKTRQEAGCVFAIIVVVIMLFVAGVVGWPYWRVWQQGMSGKAKLREAEWSRQILVEEAQAAKQSEILRAEGVAEANRIVADSLKDRKEYLTYLWLQSLGGTQSQVIYVPTEANLPILEAGRIRHSEP